MDVTHIADFGKLRYVLMKINIYSGFLMATAQTGEATKHETIHFFKLFSYIGTLKIIETDNRCEYVSKAF